VRFGLLLDVVFREYDFLLQKFRRAVEKLQIKPGPRSPNAILVLMLVIVDRPVGLSNNSNFPRDTALPRKLSGIVAARRPCQARKCECDDVLEVFSFVKPETLFFVRR